MKTIEFGPQITTIVGSSEVGKSAIIRALTWLCLNQWNGPKEDIHTGEKFTKVKLFVDGHEIVRKNSKGNLYRLDKSIYRAFGTDVPEAIANLLNVSEVNFQGQFDPHFWLADSPGAVSKKLNSIVDLEIIDRCLSNLSSQVRRSRLVVDVSTQRLKEAKSRRDQLEWVVDADNKLKELESKHLVVEGMTVRIDRITFLVDELSTYQSTLGKWEECGRQGQFLTQKGQRLGNLQKRIDRLANLLTQLKTVGLLSQLVIPKLGIDRRDKIQRLSQLIDQIKIQQSISNQICPICEQELR